MAPNEIKVPSVQLRQAAVQWQGLSSGLTSAAPSPGRPYQPTTAAIGAIDAAIGVGAAAAVARLQNTAAGVVSAATDYTSQDITGHGQLAAVAPPLVMV
jgi:hypothetical protein